jgi:HSP20 family molecular chaperone IbpA
MEGHTRARRNNWVITIESNKEKHQAILRSAVAKRAYHLFEQRGRKHGLDLDDWMAAEKQLLADDFSGDTSAFRFVIECPGDPEMTTTLSLTTHSLVVLRSHARHARGAENEPEIASVHVMPEEIDPARVEIQSVDGLLHVRAPKKIAQVQGRLT